VDVSGRFEGVVALADVSLESHAGEVLDTWRSRRGIRRTFQRPIPSRQVKHA
jgi:hypothetical protein